MLWRSFGLTVGPSLDSLDSEAHLQRDTFAVTKFWNCNLALGFASRCLPFPSLPCSTLSYPHSTRVMIARAQLPCFVLVWFIASLMAMTLTLSLSLSLSLPLSLAVAQVGIPGRLVSGVCHLKSTFCFAFRWKPRISIATSNMCACVSACLCVHGAYLLARFCARPQRELTEFYQKNLSLVPFGYMQILKLPTGNQSWRCIWLDLISECPNIWKYLCDIYPQRYCLLTFTGNWREKKVFSFSSQHLSTFCFLCPPDNLAKWRAKKWNEPINDHNSATLYTP